MSGLWPQSALHLPEGQAFIRKPPESDESGLPAVTALDLSYQVLGYSMCIASPIVTSNMLCVLSQCVPCRAAGASQFKANTGSSGAQPSHEGCQADSEAEVIYAYFKTNMTLFVLASSAQQPPCACEGWAPEQPEWAFSQTCSNCTAGYNIGSSCQHTDMLLVRMGDAVHTE